MNNTVCRQPHLLTKIIYNRRLIGYKSNAKSDISIVGYNVTAERNFFAVWALECKDNDGVITEELSPSFCVTLEKRHLKRR